MALENLKVAGQNQDLRLQLGQIAVAGCDHAQQDANERVEKRAHHLGAKS